MNLISKRHLLPTVLLLILLVVAVAALLVNAESKPNDGCVDSGNCHLCNEGEMSTLPCAATGKRIKIICNGYDNNEYRSCYMTSEDQQYRVLLFQGAMAIIGSLAFWGVQSRKNKNLTLFENRKLTRNGGY